VNRFLCENEGDDIIEVDEDIFLEQDSKMGLNLTLLKVKLRLRTQKRKIRYNEEMEADKNEFQ
jgi:hypothetical protein